MENSGFSILYFFTSLKISEIYSLFFSVFKFFQNHLYIDEKIKFLHYTISNLGSWRPMVAINEKKRIQIAKKRTSHKLPLLLRLQAQQTWAGPTIPRSCFLTKYKIFFPSQRVDTGKVHIFLHNSYSQPYTGPAYSIFYRFLDLQYLTHRRGNSS